jgi:DNA-binding MarR family transcriptional regulator
MRRETGMQAAVLDVIEREEGVTQDELARRFGVTRSAIAQRLRRFRRSNDLAARPVRRPKHRRAVRFVQLSTVTAAGY